MCKSATFCFFPELDHFSCGRVNFYLVNLDLFYPTPKKPIILFYRIFFLAISLEFLFTSIIVIT